MSNSPFRIKKAVHLDEIESTLTQAEHIQSGAQIVHIGNRDPENLFSLSFRTYPKSSNGAPHILEHTVLCGSRKFPIRDPFFSMLRRSMATFMNAMTGDDLTFYPASSQIQTDFYNLLDVYIDAIFFPNLSRTSFLQEGHRFEFADPSNTRSKLEIKGIVYNEMKGALSSPDARLYHATMAALFPDTPYGFNSGGEPEAIRTLTYEQLLEFHRTYYHPSRCTFFFYGNWPLSDHLAYLEERLLSKADREPLPDPMPSQPRFSSPRAVEGVYPATPEEEDALLALGWLTCAPTDLQEVLALEVADLLLTATDASPLKRALLESGLCTQVSSFIDADNLDVPWLFFLRGVDPAKVEEIERLVRETVEAFLPEERAIDAAIHQLEFDRSEITGDGHPHGLNLFGRTIPLLQHGGNPEDGLRIHSLFAKLRERCHEEGYLKGVIERYLLSNTHHTRVLLRPDSRVDEREAEEEERWLRKEESQLSDEQRQEIVERAQELAELQEQEEDLSLLPKLALKDVPLVTPCLPLTHCKAGEVTRYHHACFTNKIGYLSVYYDLPECKESELPWVRLFASLAPQVGSGGRDYVETLDQVLEHTGGIGCGLALNTHATNFHRFRASLGLSGRALEEKTPHLLRLMRELIESCDFSDRERIKTLIAKQHTNLEQGLSRNALPYATSLAGSAISIASHISESWWGLDYLRTIRQLADHIDDRLDELIAKLEGFRERLFRTEGGDLVLSCSEKQLQQMESLEFGGIAELESHNYTPLTGIDELPKVESQGVVIASPVAFTCKLIPTVSYNHPDAPLLSVASRLFVDQVLHTRIREQGGAYGSGASNNSALGHFHFFAYRDPNLASTLDAFDEAIEMAASGRFDEEALEEAKLRLLQKMDAPIAPGSRGAVAYGRHRQGKSDSMRQQFRDRILSATREEISEAVERHIQANWEKAVTVCCSGSDFLKEENRKMEAAGRAPLPIVST